jgi:hypothetical protein
MLKLSITTATVAVAVVSIFFIARSAQTNAVAHDQIAMGSIFDLTSSTTNLPVETYQAF